MKLLAVRFPLGEGKCMLCTCVGVFMRPKILLAVKIHVMASRVITHVFW
jgi:hypothetical protein